MGFEAFEVLYDLIYHHCPIVKTYPQSGTVVSEFSKDQLDTMITDALKISRYDFSSLVYVRVLLEIEVCKLCAVNRTEEDLKNIENTLVELEEKFDTDLRVEKDFAFHQAIAQGGHNPVISSLLLIITPDILKYYQKYKVCAVPQKTVHAEHREMLQKIKDRDKEGMKELVIRHLANLIDFAKIGVGVACVIRSFVSGELADGSLVEVPLGIPIHEREVGFSYKENLKPSKSLQSFIDFYKNFNPKEQS